MRIATVIVTYNRLNLLQKCLASVRAQSQPIDQIILVNNGSTDGTAEWLAGQSGVEVIQQENVGGAGGFSRGMRAAVEAGADWIWIMDDDVTVVPDCLEVLLRYRHLSQCLHPRKHYADGPEFVSETFFDPDTCLAYDLGGNVSFRNGKDICFVSTACFEGMLVHRTVVEKTGYPDARFFIALDDTMYGFQASLNAHVAVVRDALIHTVKTSDPKPPTDFFLYYYIRNRHLVEEIADRLRPSGNRRSRTILYNLYLIKMLLVFPWKSRRTFSEKLSTFRTVWSACRAYRKRETGPRRSAT